MVEKLQNHEASSGNEIPDDWEEKLASMEFDEEKAKAARQAALDGIKRIEDLRQDEGFRQQELDIYKARKEHGDDPDYTHIYWIRDGGLVVEMGDSREELPVAEAVEKYKDNPFFQAEYAFLTHPAKEN